MVGKEDYREKLIREITINIDENRDQWKRAAFYSDETVQNILDRLYSEWEKNNKKGKPLDYATIDELETLAILAKKYSRMDSALAMRAFLMGDRPSVQEEIKSRGGGWKKALRRLLLMGS